MPDEIINAELGTTQPRTPEPSSLDRAPGPPRPLKTRLSWLDKTFRDVWFYIAAILVVVNLTYNFRPQLTIQSSSPADHPQATLFTVSNNGPWTLYEVNFFCEINGILTTGNTVSRTPGSAVAGDAPVAILPSGQTATRDCATVVTNTPPDNVRIDLFISYNWLWGFKSGLLTRHYDTRRMQGHVILVPDVEAAVPSSR
jgi:hypothetical protein